MIASRSDWLCGTAVYALTTLPVLLGVIIGTTPGVLKHDGPPPDFLHGCCHFDGGHFESIVQNGYWYDPAQGSNVAFFPGYPVAVDAVARITDWSTRLAMVATSNVALLASFVLLAAYLRTRYPNEPLTSRLTVLALIGLWPVGFFFRMGYSESLFLLTLVLLLIGFTRRWPVVVLAFVAGAATGIRAVGIAASAAVLVEVLLDTSRGSIRQRILTATLLLPMSCWGLITFMGFQYFRFGTPIAFVLVQQHWAFYVPASGDISFKAVRLAVAEPIWNAYVPGSSRYWARFESYGMPILGLAFWNPILFLLAAIAVATGWCRGCLARPEALLGIGLLVVPYFTRADELSMGSHARFAAVVIPAFIVTGRLLTRLHPAATWTVFALIAPLLMLWTSLFAARWPLC